MRWLTFTGSRADGPCPACSSSTSSPPVSSASRSPNAAGRMRSSVPCTTTTGHVTCRASGATGSHTAPSHPIRPAVVSARVCGEISCAQPTQSSICLVECGSENILWKKNSVKSS